MTITKHLKTFSLALVLGLSALKNPALATENYVGGSEVVIATPQLKDEQLIKSIEGTISVARDAISATHKVSAAYSEALKNAQELVANCSLVKKSELKIASFREAYERSCEQSLSNLERISEHIAEVVDRFPHDVKEHLKLIENGQTALKILISRHSSTKAFEQTLDSYEALKKLNDKIENAQK